MLLEKVGGHGPIAADEAVVWLLARLRPFVSEAVTASYAHGRQGHGSTYTQLLANTKRSAVHLEMRDSYDRSDPAFQDWLAGGPGTYDRSGWTDLVSEAVARQIRRTNGEKVRDGASRRQIMT